MNSDKLGEIEMTISTIDQSQRKAARIVFIISPNFAKEIDLW